MTMMNPFTYLFKFLNFCKMAAIRSVAHPMEKRCEIDPKSSLIKERIPILVSKIIKITPTKALLKFEV